MPRIVHAAAAGDLELFLKALPVGSGDDFVAAGRYLSVTCAEATARIRPEEIEAAVAGTFLGDYRVREQMAACGLWPQRDPPESFFEPVVSDVPVLLLVGDLDHITPPAWSAQVARGLSASRVVVMPHTGHLFWAWEPSASCFDGLAHAFFAAGTANGLDTTCAESVAPPEFQR